MASNEENNGAVVRITNREIYDKLVGVEAATNALILKVEGLDREITEAQRDLTALDGLNLRDHGDRIRKLELKFYGMLSGLLVALIVMLRLGSVPGV